jgi:hypothetical protein
MNRQLFLGLCAHIEASVPQFRFIDWDGGQLDIAGERPPVLFPCCLIDIQYTDCRDLDDATQLVTAALTLKLGFCPQGETNTGAPEAVRQRALETFDTIQKLHESLQGETFSGTVSEIARRKALKKVRKDRVQVYTLTYNTTFQELPGED